MVAQNHFSDPSLTWPQSQGSYSLPVLPRNTGNSSLPTSPLAHRHSAPSSAATFSPGYNSWQDPLPYQPQHSQQQSQTSIPDYPSIVPSHTNQPHALFSLRPTSQGSSRAVAAFSPSLQLPMGHMQNYPSPHSDVSKDERRSSTFSYLPSNDLSPNMMLVASPSVQSHHSPSSAGKRGEEPPRNASGQITCNHPKCASDQPVFSRRCEWT